MAAFFFFGFAGRLGTPSTSEAGWEVGWERVAGAGAGLGSWRRELKLDMNSMACGESPKRFLKWSAASTLESEFAYSSICFKSESGSPSSIDN